MPQLPSPNVLLQRERRQHCYLSAVTAVALFLVLLFMTGGAVEEHTAWVQLQLFPAHAAGAPLPIEMPALLAELRSETTLVQIARQANLTPQPASAPRHGMRLNASAAEPLAAPVELRLECTHPSGDAALNLVQHWAQTGARLHQRLIQQELRRRLEELRRRAEDARQAVLAAEVDLQSYLSREWLARGTTQLPRADFAQLQGGLTGEPRSGDVLPAGGQTAASPAIDARGESSATRHIRIPNIDEPPSQAAPPPAASPRDQAREGLRVRVHRLAELRGEVARAAADETAAWNDFAAATEGKRTPAAGEQEAVPPVLSLADPPQVTAASNRVCLRQQVTFLAILAAAYGVAMFYLSRYGAGVFHDQEQLRRELPGAILVQAPPGRIPRRSARGLARNVAEGSRTTAEIVLGATLVWFFVLAWFDARFLADFSANPLAVIAQGMERSWRILYK